jgi:hypothetical protein
MSLDPSQQVMPCWEDLDFELWVLILQRVPSKQRLSTCALACRKLARAAEAAATSLELTFYRGSMGRVRSQERHSAFLRWASSHGSFLTQLSLTSKGGSIHQLACPNLLELRLVACRVQLCAGHGYPGLLNSCTALTRLELDNCPLLDDGAALPRGGVASVAAQLRHLDMPSCCLPDRGRLLPHLTSLTHLSLNSRYSESTLWTEGRWGAGHLLQRISSMARLEQLSLRGVSGEQRRLASPDCGSLC